MFNTRTEQPRLLLLDPARGKERLREMAPAAARRRGGDGAAVLRQGFAKHYGGGGGVGEGEGGTKGKGKKSYISSTIYRRAKGGRQP